MTLLERLGRREEKGKAEVKEENIFAGRAVDAKEEEYQALKLNVHRAIVEEMTSEQQKILDGTNRSRQDIENVISGYVQRVLEHILLWCPEASGPVWYRISATKSWATAPSNRS